MPRMGGMDGDPGPRPDVRPPTGEPAPVAGDRRLPGGSSVSELRAAILKGGALPLPNRNMDPVVNEPSPPANAGTTPDRTVTQIANQEPNTADQLTPQGDVEPANTRIGYWSRWGEVLRNKGAAIKSTLSDPDFYINAAASTAINQTTKAALLTAGYSGWWAMPGVAAASAAVGYGRKQISETNKAYLSLDGKEAEKSARLWQIKELKRRREEIRSSDNGEEIIKSINKKAVEGAAIAAIGSLVGGTIANSGMGEMVWGHVVEKSGWVADWFKNLSAHKPGMDLATPQPTPDVPAGVSGGEQTVSVSPSPSPDASPSAISSPAASSSPEPVSSPAVASPSSEVKVSPTTEPIKVPPTETPVPTRVPLTSTPVPPTMTPVPPTAVPTSTPDLPAPEPTSDPLIAKLSNSPQILAGGEGQGAGDVVLEPQENTFLNYKGIQAETVLQQQGSRNPPEIKSQLDQWVAHIRANGEAQKYVDLLNAPAESQPTTFGEPLYTTPAAPAELAMDTPLGPEFPSLKGYLEGVYANNLFESQFADQDSFNEFLIQHGQDPNNKDWQKVWEGIAADKIPNTHDGKVLSLRDMLMQEKGVDSKTYNERVLALYNYVKTKTPESNFAARDSDFFDRSKGIILPADMKKWWTDLEDIK